MTSAALWLVPLCLIVTSSLILGQSRDSIQLSARRPRANRGVASRRMLNGRPEILRDSTLSGIRTFQPNPIEIEGRRLNRFFQRQILAGSDIVGTRSLPGKNGTRNKREQQTAFTLPTAAHPCTRENLIMSQYYLNQNIRPCQQIYSPQANKSNEVLGSSYRFSLASLPARGVVNDAFLYTPVHTRENENFALIAKGRLQNDGPPYEGAIVSRPTAVEGEALHCMKLNLEAVIQNEAGTFPGQLLVDVDIECSERAPCKNYVVAGKPFLYLDVTNTTPGRACSI